MMTVRELIDKVMAASIKDVIKWSAAAWCSWWAVGVIFGGDEARRMAAV